MIDRRQLLLTGTAALVVAPLEASADWGPALYKTREFFGCRAPAFGDLVFLVRGIWRVSTRPEYATHICMGAHYPGPDGGWEILTAPIEPFPYRDYGRAYMRDFAARMAATRTREVKP